MGGKRMIEFSTRYINGYVIDEDGFIIDTVVVDLHDDKYQKLPNVVTESPQIGVTFYKLKWTGAEWVEGATSEEIKLIKEKMNPNIPTETELLKQRLEDLELMLAEMASL